MTSVIIFMELKHWNTCAVPRTFFSTTKSNRSAWNWSAGSTRAFAKHALRIYAGLPFVRIHCDSHIMLEPSLSFAWEVSFRLICNYFCYHMWCYETNIWNYNFYKFMLLEFGRHIKAVLWIATNTDHKWHNNLFSNRVWCYKRKRHTW